jgi:predicted O-methyltransferase YrrM
MISAGGSVAEEIWSTVESYFDAELNAKDPELDAALEASVAAGLPAVQVSAAQGKLLYLLALSQGAKRILEVGTLGGYSTLWLARALPANGRLVTLELSPQHAVVARQNFVNARIADRVEMHVGPARETLTRLRAQHVAPFDLVFIDADKANNLHYVQAALELSRIGTLIMVDNVVREGAVLSPERDAAAQGVRRMTAWIGAEPRLAAISAGTRAGDLIADGPRSRAKKLPIIPPARGSATICRCCSINSQDRAGSHAAALCNYQEGMAHAKPGIILDVGDLNERWNERIFAVRRAYARSGLEGARGCKIYRPQKGRPRGRYCGRAPYCIICTGGRPIWKSVCG